MLLVILVASLLNACSIIKQKWFSFSASFTEELPGLEEKKLSFIYFEIQREHEQEEA